MSRIDELKKQTPCFNLSYFDIFRRLDPTKSGKYLPVFTKVFLNDVNRRIGDLSDHNYEKNLKQKLSNYGFNFSEMNMQELLITNHFIEIIGETNISLMSEFIGYMERGLVDNKDVLTYKNIDDVRGAISLASLKEHSKNLSSQIKNEYEDDTWLILRPLSFEASLKYGASTKWCTTYKREKEYFAKYFSRGVLVYFINKKTGYKFAMFSEVYEGNNEISFWTADDTRVDFLSLNFDYHLVPIIKTLANSKVKNSDLLTEEEKHNVLIDCNYYDLKVSEPRALVEVPYEDQVPEPMENMYDYPDVPMGNITITTNDEAGNYLLVNTTTSVLTTPNYIYNIDEERA